MPPQKRTKLLVQSLDFGAIPLPLRILKCIPLKHQVCGHWLNVEPVGDSSQQSNPCTAPTGALMMLLKSIVH